MRCHDHPPDPTLGPSGIVREYARGNRRFGPRLETIGEWLTRDYCSWFDPFVKWIHHPCAVVLIALAVALVCGVYLHPRAFILAAALGAVLALGTVWPWLSIRGLSGTLTFDRGRVREGEPIQARLLVRNRMPWSAWGLVVRGRVAGEESTGLGGLAVAAGGRVTESSWDLVPDRRGEFPGLLPRIASGFPFGIHEASRPIEVPQRLLVWPRTFPVGPMPEALGGQEGDGLAPRNRPGSAGDLLGVRPYRRGDSLRRVHWPQSARHGRLIVCELEAQALPRVQIVLDVHPESHRGQGPNGSFEWAVRVAASFAEDWIGQGAEVEIVCGTRQVVAAGGTVAGRRVRMLDVMARLAPDNDLTLAEVLNGLPRRDSRAGSRIVIATTRSALEPPPRNRDERFVVLNADAFAAVDTGSGRPHVARHSLPVRPWIWIDDPSNVPGQVRRGGKEHVHVC